MQPTRLASVHSDKFEKTFENSHWKKSLKCNQSDDASVLARNLRRHLKTYSGKKSLKCNQCDNAFVQTGSLPTSENSLPRKVVQLQPMQLCICFGRQFEKTFENSLWKKIVHMQPTRLRICSLRRFEKTFETHTGIKSLKCNQCDYAPVLAGNWKRKLTLEKNRSNSTNATSHLFTQTI